MFHISYIADLKNFITILFFNSKKLSIQKKVVFLRSQLMSGAVAQSVEQRTENPCVGSSILSSTTEDLRNFFLGLFVFRR